LVPGTDSSNLKNVCINYKLMYDAFEMIAVLLFKIRLPITVHTLVYVFPRLRRL